MKNFGKRRDNCKKKYAEKLPCCLKYIPGNPADVI